MPDCFVIMPFSTTNEDHSQEYWSEHFEYFIKPAIEGAAHAGRLLGYRAKFSDPVGGGIVGDVFKSLQEADVVLAELTDFNPNVMYELGIRHSLKERTIMILEEDMQIPFYFKNYKIIRYSKKKSAREISHFNETIQRRLLELSQNKSISSDNPVSEYLRSIGQKAILVPQNEPDMKLSAILESGITSIYVPNTNSERNVRKEDIIFEAEQYIKLLATTGHSYLAMVGSRFKGVLVNRLGANIPVQIILLHPWTDSGVLLALGEVPKVSQTEIQAQALERIEQGHLSGFDPVKLIKASIYYQNKLPTSIQGYLDLNKQFKRGIDLRLVPHEISATVLLTENTGFFEPYLHANLLERMRSSMLTFELEFSNKSHLQRHCLSYFNLLWRLSIPYQAFLDTEDIWKARLRDKYERQDTSNEPT